MIVAVQKNSGDMIVVQVSKHFQASPERVFDAWLYPEKLSRWMFGTTVRDEEIIHLEVDPRVGGRFSFLVRRGDTEIDHVGEYLEMDRPRRLVFTWAIRENLPDTSRVFIDISPELSGCKLTLTHEMNSKWADFAKRTEMGWTVMLEKLAAAEF